MSKRKRRPQEGDGDDALSLRVGEVPSHPFVNKPFQLAVVLVDRASQPHMGMQADLKFCLCYEDGSPVSRDGALVINPAKPSINTANGSAMLQVTVNELSADHSTEDAPHRRFRIRVSTSDTTIQAAMSNVICTVAYRLKVMRNVPDCWYKDEGGRDNCMDVSLLLVDAKDNPARLQKNLPLTASLRYDGDVEVRNQTILKIDHTPAPDKKIFVDRNGQATLRLRIDEVSKNHQKQPFCVRIDPDISSDDSRMMRSTASALTGSVVVKSKKSKRARKSKAVPVKSTAPPPMPRFTRASTRTRELTADAVDSETLQTLTGTESKFITACHGVISWCQFVVKQLGDMEWQHIGYEMNEYNQTLDGNRPIFRCPGCFQYKSSLRPVSHTQDCPVNTAINMYGNSVKQHLLGLQLSAKHQLHAIDAVPTLQTTARSLSVHRSDSKQTPTLDLSTPRPLRQITNDDGFRFPEDKGFQPPLFMRNLSDGLTSDGDFAKMLQGDQAYFPGDEVSFQNMDEAKVFSIVTRPCLHGFPAFTEAKGKEAPKVCGFYTYNDTMGGLVFAPVAGFESRGQQLIEEIESSWEKYKADDVIIDKKRCVTLARLKEEALLMHFQNQANDFIS